MPRNETANESLFLPSRLTKGSSTCSSPSRPRSTSSPSTPTTAPPSSEAPTPPSWRSGRSSSRGGACARSGTAGGTTSWRRAGSWGTSGRRLGRRRRGGGRRRWPSKEKKAAARVRGLWVGGVASAHARPSGPSRGGRRWANAVGGPGARRFRFFRVAFPSTFVHLLIQTTRQAYSFVIWIRELPGEPYSPLDDKRDRIDHTFLRPWITVASRPRPPHPAPKYAIDASSRVEAVGNQS